MFFYFYKTSGKFRQSIIAAFVTIIFFYSSQQPAHSVGEADAFNFQQQQQHTVSSRDSGIFGHKSRSNSSPGPEKPNGSDDSGMPKFPETESVHQTKDRLDNIDQYIDNIDNMEESSDSESEEGQCKVTAVKITEKFQLNPIKKLVNKAFFNSSIFPFYIIIFKRLIN